MATTENNFTGNGTRVSHAFTFPYLNTSDVKIGLTLGTGAEQVLAATEYTFPNATTLKLDTIDSATTWQETSGAPKSGIKVRVHRKTADDNVASTFYPGSAIRSSDLNDNFTQNLYVTQEARNITGDSTTIANEAKTLASTADTNATTALSTANAADTIADTAKLATDRLVATTSNSGTSWTLAGNNTNASTDPKGVGYAVTTAEAASTTATNASNSVGNKIDKDGSVAMTAALTLSGAPTSDLHASTKKYVDDYLIDEDNFASDSATRLPSQQSVKAYIGTTNYTKTESDARYFTQDTETIDSTETWSAGNTAIATTQAIDNRIISLTTEVGGFVPIANETSFPDTNPDVNDGAGTLVSIKAIATNFTSNGSGVATIANGNVSNSSAVTINGLDNSTTYNAGYGMIVETTSTLHTYAFHRLLPKATEVTTVAGNNTNINTVATNITNINSNATNLTNINAVADNEANIDIVAGELVFAEDLGLVSEALTSSSGNNIDTVAGAITNINTVAGNNGNITTVAGANSNITAVAGSISNVNSVASNIANVNNFNDLYQIAGSQPSTDGGGNSVAEGDLWYDSTNNVLKYYTGSAWASIAAGIASLIADTSPELGGHLDCNDKNLTEVATVSGDNLQIDFGAIA